MVPGGCVGKTHLARSQRASARFSSRVRRGKGSRATISLPNPRKSLLHRAPWSSASQGDAGFGEACWGRRLLVAVAPEKPGQAESSNPPYLRFLMPGGSASGHGTPLAPAHTRVTQGCCAIPSGSIVGTEGREDNHLKGPRSQRQGKLAERFEAGSLRLTEPLTGTDKSLKNNKSNKKLDHKANDIS